MYNWFECKVRIDKPMENGASKKVTVPYLVEALNFTEAEARIIKEISPFAPNGVDVTDIKRAKYSELFPGTDPDADKWYKVKCVFEIIDEKSQSTKTSATNMLVCANNLHQALDVFEENMKGTISDYSIGLIQETAIMDIFPYETTVGEDKAPV